jgi:hypothetical protein
MDFRRIAIVGILVAAVGALSFGWYRYVAHPAPVACAYCSRPLHANLSVIAEIEGKRAQVCCARCAISEANQERKPLRLITVHDTMRMNEMKGAEDLAFDRCSPPTFAFANRQDADSFTAQNGGAVLSFAQLMSEARFQ